MSCCRICTILTTLDRSIASSLAVSGVDGTLRRRFRMMKDKEDQRKTVADWVYCIGGLVLGVDGDIYSVVILINDLKTKASNARTLQDSFFEKLIRFEEANK